MSNYDLGDARASDRMISHYFIILLNLLINEKLILSNQVLLS